MHRPGRSPGNTGSRSTREQESECRFLAQEGNVATTELEKKPSQAIDPEQEPSVEWGWHGGFPRATQVAGWVSVIAMLCMLIGNQQGILSGGGHFTESDIWLIGLAAATAIGLLYDIRRKRNAW